MDPTLASPTQTDSAANISNMEVMGQVAWLMTQSPLHRKWAIASLLQWVLPALLNKQYRVYSRNGKPVAYVSWAWLSQEKETAYALNPRCLQPVDWKSGSRLWIVDLVSPFGATKEVIQDLRRNIFRDEVGRALRVKPGSEEMRIWYLHGADAVEKSRDWERSPTVQLQTN